MQSPNRKIISIVLSIVMIISSMSVCFSVFAGDAIEIKTADDLKSMKNNLSASYVLADDIAIPADMNFEPIGSLKDPFTGSFDGQGHLISGLTVNQEEDGYVGLFGFIGAGAIVENLELSVRSIKGQDNVGAIAGANMGTVSGCFVSCGTVEGAGRVGGIVGANSGTVEKCRANLDLIKGNQIVGGIVALNDENGKIDLCIAMSDIEAINMVGGIFAMSAANTTVSDCVVQNCTITAKNSVGGIGWMMHGNASATRLVCSSDVTINCPGSYCYTVLSGGTKGANCKEITVLSEVLDFLTQDAALADRSGPMSHFIQNTIPAEGDGFDAQRPGVWAGKLNEDGTGEINFTVFTGENACLHSNIVDVAAVEATCEEDGATASRKCEDCGKVMLLSVVIPALGHTEEAVPGKPATCTESGLTDGVKCSVCDKILTAQEEIAATGHTEETIPGKAATCTEAGLTDGVKCTVCGETLTAQEEIPATGHTEETIPGKEATCTETGLTDGVKCSVCGEILVAQEEIPTLNHRIIDTKAEEATCVHPAYSAGKYCLDCAKYISGHEELPGGLGDHKLVKIYAADPTCYREGQTAGVMCTNKGCTYREGGEVLKKVPHTYNEWTANGDGTHTAECAVCKEAGQAYTWPTSEACTCEWVTVKVADCENDGLKENKCSVCGYVSETESIPATDHTEETIPGKAATCTETGLTDGVKCSVCGEILAEQEVIPALGHDWGEWIVVTDSTCTTAGEEKRVCANDATHAETREISAKGHTFVDVITTPTCITDGYTTHTCSVCGYSYQDEVVKALGHTEETVPGKAATCTETGLTDGVKCTVCGETLTAQEEIAALGHTEETIPGKAATCTETGLTDGVKCTVCGETLTAQEEIAALGHTEETIPGKAATCTETGLTDGVKCSVCGEILVAQEEIPTLNHRIIDTKAEEATCVHPAYSAGKYCLDCAKYISGHEELPGGLGDHKLAKIYAADPTCYREGQTAGVMCTNKGCTYREGGEVLKKVPHTYNVWTANGDGTHTAECSVCKEAGQPYTWPTSEDCTFEWVIVSVADCENDGLKEYKCSVCGYVSETESIPALGHTEETIPGKSATCTEAGLTEGVKCSVCGEILTEQEEIAATGHTEETIPGKAATCTETGLTEGVKCSVCGEILVAQEEIPTLNHRIIDTKAEEATCVHPAYSAGKYCLDCAKYISGHEELPGGLGDHKLVKIYAADPTCYREGQTAGVMCTNKGCTYREGGEVLKKVPHTYNVWTANGDGTHTAECSVCKEAGQPYTWPTSEDCTFEWVIVSVADCENDGLKEYKCSVCGYVSETESIPALGHTEETIPGKAATCTEAGLTEGVKCSVCGEILTAQEEIPALGHTEETIPGKAATCTETGLTDGVKCTVCGETLTAQEEIPATGHTEETIPGKEATCTETGLTDGVKCSVCGEILVAQEEIPTLNHRIIDTKAEEATCVHPAYSAGKYCLDCAKYISGHEELPGGLGDHKLVKIYAADPTCYREGQTAGVMCTNKGCTYREGGEVLKKVPHTYNVWKANGDGTHTAECSVCKEAGQPYTWPTSEDCTFEWVIVSVADCENDGLKEYKCSVCGYVSETESIPATGHTEETIPGKAATCTESGLTEGKKCSVCGEILTEQEEIAALGHTEETIPGKEATCTETGLTDGVKCSVCGEILTAQEEIAALGHTEETIPGKAATCTETGLTDGVKCSVCGEILTAQEEIPATGHTEETIPGKAATCTETGLTDGVKCTVCGEILTAQEEIPATGHTKETIPGKAATCTETGLTDGVKCSVCGEILTAQEEIAALGHTEETIPGKAATCTETGLTDGVKCSVCGEILTAQEEIAALGHTEETIPGKASTCTETGLTDGVKCSVCGEILTAQEEIPALGHTEETIPGKAATCTETGLTDGVKCSVCGEILTAQEVVDALGHAYGEWTVVTEATCTEKGEEQRVCANDASHVETREIPVASHNDKDGDGCCDDCRENICEHAESKLIGKMAATCTEKGFTGDTVCTKCGVVLENGISIAPIGHAYGKWVVVTEATCTTPGKEQRICANDANHVETREIFVTPHNDNDGDGICDDCGKDFSNHTHGDSNGDDLCDVCGKCLCLCHGNSIFAYILRLVCTILSIVTLGRIACCSDMAYYLGDVGDLT